MISRSDSSVFPGVASQVQGFNAHAEARWQCFRLQVKLSHLVCFPSSGDKDCERPWDRQSFLMVIGGDNGFHRHSLLIPRMHHKSPKHVDPDHVPADFTPTHAS
jgi:hypothetical protein